MDTYFWHDGLPFRSALLSEWQAGLKKRPILYLFGASGLGKSCYARALAAYMKVDSLYFSSLDRDYQKRVDDFFETWRDSSSHHLLIVDNLGFYLNAEQEGWMLERFFSDDQVPESTYVLLIAGVKLPELLFERRLSNRLYVVNGDVLYLTEADIFALLMRDQEGRHIWQKEEALYRAHECFSITEGYPLAVQSYVYHLHHGERSIFALERRVSEDIYKDFESTWPSAELSPRIWLMLALSIFSWFTYDMAEALLGEEVVPLLDDVRRSFLILIESGESFRFVPFVREYLQKKFSEEFSEEKRHALYIRAGEINRAQDREWDAFLCFEAAGDDERLMQSAIRLIERSHCQAIRKLARENTLERFPESWDDRVPNLLGARILIKALQMRLTESYDLLDKLKEKAEGEIAASETKQIGPFTAAYLQALLSLPHSNFDHLIPAQALLYDYLISGQITSLTIDSKAKDREPALALILLSSLSDPQVEVRFHQLIDKPLRDILGVSIATYLYESGRRVEAIHLASNMMRNLSKVEMRIKLALDSLFLRMNLLDGRIGKSREILKRQMSDAKQMADTDAIPDIEIGLIYLDLMENRLDPVRAWLRAEERNFELPVLSIDYHRIFAHVYAYLSLNDALSAYQRLSLLEDYISRIPRSYLALEFNIMKAIVLHRMGEVWQPHLLAALKLGVKYNISQIFVDRGVALLPLWQSLSLSDPEEKAFQQRVSVGLKRMANHFPRFLITGTGDTVMNGLSPREFDVLKLLGLGLSNQKIATRLNISITTVKFHVTNILQKLGAKNRTDAVRVARERTLI